MFRKGLHREFPVFFTYLFFELLQFAFLYAISLHLLTVAPSLYVKFDLYGRIGSTILHFGILQELFEAPLKDNPSLRQTTRRFLWWVTAFIVALAFAMIAIQYSNSLGHRLLSSYATILAFNVAQCFLLGLMFLWHRYLGLSMASFVFGIALGMGWTASLELLILEWKDSIVIPNSRVPDFLQMGVYHCAVLIWLGFALAYRRITLPSGKLRLAEDQRLMESVAEMERVVRP